MKSSTKKSLLAAFSLSAALISFSSCSSSNDDPSEHEELSNYKITVTLDNVNAADDYVAVVAVGTTYGAKTDVWKVNGVVRTGESSISLGDTDFTGATKTYVLETTEPIRLFNGGAEIVNYKEDLGVHYKIEKNGKVIINENEVLKGDGSKFTKNYSF